VPPVSRRIRTTPGYDNNFSARFLAFCYEDKDITYFSSEALGALALKLIDGDNSGTMVVSVSAMVHVTRTRTRINTTPDDTEANAAAISGNARALRNHEGEEQRPKFSQNIQTCSLQKARHLYVLHNLKKL